MIDWTKPLKPIYPDLHKLELLKILKNGDCPYVLAITNLSTGLEDVIFLDKYGKNCFNKEILASNVKPPEPHKHADIIKAWADGFKVAMWFESLGKYYLVEHPTFAKSFSYAVIDGQGYNGPATVATLDTPNPRSTK